MKHWVEILFDRLAAIYLTKGPAILVCAVIAAGVMFLATDSFKAWCGNVV